MRSAPVVLLAASLAAIVTLVLLAATRTTAYVYSDGVDSYSPVIALRHGDAACQRGLQLPDAAWFDRIVVPLGTYGKPGPPLDLKVRSSSGEILARGHLDGGYPDIRRRPREVLATARTQPTGPLSVCLRNEGRRRVAVYGGPGLASPTTTMTLNGHAAAPDLSVAFARAHPPSVLASVPDMLERATVFKAGAISRVTLAALAALAFAGTPLLLTWGLRRAMRADDDSAE